MNWKATVALLVFTAAVCGWLYRSGPPGPTGERDSRLVFGHSGGKPPALEKIVVETVDGRTELIRGSDGLWLLARPVSDRADERILGELVGLLEALPKIETLPATAERIDSTGLREPRVRLSFTRRGEPPQSLDLGNTTPVEGRVYALVAGAGEIVVIPKTLRDLVQRPSAGFRDVRLTAGLAEKVVRFSIKNQRGTVELTRENGKWELAGGGGRGSAKLIDEWLEKVLGYGVRRFVGPDLGDLFSYGLAVPRATVRIEQEARAGRDVAPIEWFLGDRTEARLAGVYVRVPERRSVVVLPLDAEEVMRATVETFRERTLTALNLDFIDRVRIEPQGAPALLLARRNEGWELREPRQWPAESREMEHVVRLLNGAEVQEFARDPEQVARLMGQTPALRLVFAAYSSETTAEAGAGEVPAVTLEFSGPQAQGLRLVRNVEEKVAVWVKESVVAGLALQPAAWQQLALSGPADGELLSFEVRAGAAKSGFQFRSAGGWTRTAGPEKFEAARVESAAALLGRLRAVRFVANAEPPPGSEPSALEISARFGGRAQPLTIRVGGRTADGMWLAQVDGREGWAALTELDMRIFRVLLEGGK